jgi:AcrR family transcriptional regulator
MTTKRNPENTRLKILLAAFQEIHRYGFQGMRVDQVLKKTGLKKGALYHHFSSKQVLGYAVLDELIKKRISELFVTPLKDFNNPLEGIYNVINGIGQSATNKSLSLGCPLNNLAQEMSPIDEGFRTRIEKIFQEWQMALAEALEKGQQQGFVNQSINTKDSALFILTSVEGAIGMTKNHQNKEIFICYCSELKRYLNSLKPE